jgi:hypothetical protein
MRRGSGSSVKEEPPREEEEEEEGPSHLRRSWNSRCGGAAAGEHSAAVRVEAARVAVAARRLHRSRPDMAGGEARRELRIGAESSERERIRGGKRVCCIVVAGVVSEFLRCFSLVCVCV